MDILYTVLVVALFCIGQAKSNRRNLHQVGNTATESELKERLLSYYDPTDVFYQFPPIAQRLPSAVDAPRAPNPRRRRRRNVVQFVHYGNTCPGYFINNTNINRIPSVIAEWRCSCQLCQLPPHSVPYNTRLRYTCKPMYQLFQTLRRTDGSLPSAEWKMEFEPISVGCRCEDYTPITALVLS